jgi:hypothetical protein
VELIANADAAAIRMANAKIDLIMILRGGAERITISPAIQ